MDAGLIYVSPTSRRQGSVSSEGLDASLFTTPDIDFPGLLARVSGNRVLGVDLLRGFCTEYHHAGASVEQLVSRQCFEEARRFLHGIKGTAANLSLPGVYGSAAEYERALKLDPGAKPQLHSHFEACLKRAVEAIHHLVGEGACELPQLHQGSAQPVLRLVPLIDEARQHLCQGNVRGIDLARQLLGQARWMEPEVSAALEKCLADYDFAEADALLEKLAKRIFSIEGQVA